MLCILGMAAIGNPYYIMAGIGIGVLDALPIFGTGTVLIPWSLICLFMGRWGRALALFALYLICYLIREYLETKLMSNQVGLSPLKRWRRCTLACSCLDSRDLYWGPWGCC